MALTSTLFTGLSGLDVNQTRLNVVGNNIANVNTVAFKSSRALFKPQFYVTDAAGSPPSAGFGGTNPSQRGLGAAVSAIEKDWSNGAIEPTGRMTDMAIDGNGFFVVDGPGGQRFTRDGSFTLNSSNQLVTQGGDFVQGFGVDANYQVVPGQLRNIEIPLGAMTMAEATQNMTLVGNLDASGDVATGASILLSQPLTSAGGTVAPTGATLLTDLEDGNSGALMFTAGDVITLNGTRGGREVGAQTFTVTPTSTLDDLALFMQRGLGIDAGFTVPGGPTPGVTIEPDTATTVRLGVIGNVGTENALAIPAAGFVKQDGTGPLTFDEGSIGGFTSNPTGESVTTTMVAYDSLGTPITINVTATLAAKTDEGITWHFTATSPDDQRPDLLDPLAGLVVGSGTLTFDNFGRLKETQGTTLTIDRDLTGAGTPLTLNLDFQSMTSLTSRASDMVMTEQDGSPIGTLDSFSVGADGTITGSFTNGRTRTLGQIALATFNNPQGLVDQGGNLFVAGSNSGAATITSPLNLSAGSVRSGALELSNVDLSEQFINMIISSTGFSASSRVISTSNQLIQELLNTSR